MIHLNYRMDQPEVFHLFKRRCCKQPFLLDLHFLYDKAIFLFFAFGLKYQEVCYHHFVLQIVSLKGCLRVLCMGPNG